MSEIKVGSPVWIFDKEHRVYRKNADGISVGGPIWREHWVKFEIESETSRSWITRYGKLKIPKNDPYPSYGICWSEAEIDERAYVHDNAYSISGTVGRISDPALLRQIAELIGYKERA